jgi:hypothetical protein
MSPSATRKQHGPKLLMGNSEQKTRNTISDPGELHIYMTVP